jgi:hypothetical protein
MSEAPTDGPRVRPGTGLVSLRDCTGHRPRSAGDRRGKG